MASTGIGSKLNGGAEAIGTTAAVIVDARTTRKSVVVANEHASNVLYVGGSGVSTANGLRVDPGESVDFNDFNGAVYGVASGADTDVRFLEVY